MRELASRLLTILLKLISLLPMGVLYVVSDIFFIVLYRLTSYRTKVVSSNLRRAFPEKSEKELAVITRRYYSFLSDLIVETVKGFTAGEGFLRKRIRYRNSEILEELHRKRQSAMVVMGHCGNWEWVCRSAPFFMKNQVVVVYKPLSDPVFDQLMMQTRTRFGVEQVSMARIARDLLERKEPYLLILLSDQSPSDTNGAIWTNFLGQDTPVLPGAEKLALKFRLPVLYNDVRRTGRGQYVCETRLIAEPGSHTGAGELTALHSGLLERAIREQPETWLWSHRRWKHSRSIKQE